MGGQSDAVRPPGDDTHGRPDEDARFDTELRRLEREYHQLHEQAQQLLTERVYLENEVSQLKKKIARLDEEVRLLKSPPLIIGHVQDIINEEQAVVRSSNGTVFFVACNRRLDPEVLTAGARVALNQDTLSIVRVLSQARDPLVTGAELIERPAMSYGDIGGLADQISLLREAIEWPLERPESFRKVGIEPPKGVMLVGPPGCGKTLLAKAVAASSDATFIRLVGSELAQKYIGEGGRMVRELFSLAREKAPAIVFIDEIDSIGAKRLDTATSGDREVQRTLMQLLAELDGFDSLDDVKVIAATNRPDILDEALLRPGRFDQVIEIPLPDEEGRTSILSIHIDRMQTTKGVTLPTLVEATSGFSGADLKSLCVEAGMEAIRKGRDRVTLTDFRHAIKVVSDKRRQGQHALAPAQLYG